MTHPKRCIVQDDIEKSYDALNPTNVGTNEDHNSDGTISSYNKIVNIQNFDRNHGLGLNDHNRQL